MHKTMALALSVAVTALPTAPAAQSRHEPDASLVRNGKIAFAQDASIMLLDPDVPGRPQRVGRGFEPAWSPDGRTIAFTDRISPTAQTLFLMNADGGDRHRFPLKAGGRNDLSNYLPAWSPDGKRLAFTRSVAAPRTSSGWRVDVYIVDVDGTHLRRLTTSGSAYSATWSPDGRQVAYLGLVGSSESSRRLHVVNADGSNDRTLLSASRASWAPGGHTRDLATCMVTRRSPDRVFPIKRTADAVLRNPSHQRGRNGPTPARANGCEKGALRWPHRQHLPCLVTRRKANRLRRPPQPDPGGQHRR